MTHYIASTSLAICHVQAVVIQKFKRKLQQAGRTDAPLEKFETYERRLHELVGLPVSDVQTAAWRAALSTRAKRSEGRQTIEYIRKRKQQRAKLKEQSTCLGAIGSTSAPQQRLCRASQICAG